eukprot:SAG25_NODE_2613_length_1490_cov_1.311287_3_plen_82_part_01
MKLRASFKQAVYLTTVWLEVGNSSGAVKDVTQVLKAECKDTSGEYCRASGATHRIGYGRCTHCSATMQVLRNMLRPESLAID